MNPPNDQKPIGLSLAGFADVDLPANVLVGQGSRIVADDISRRAVFGRFRSTKDRAISVGEDSILQNVAFNLEEGANVSIGSSCDLQDCFLISADEIRIGSGVTIGWHATLIDSDFHPIEPEERRRDVLALSPKGPASSRRHCIAMPVIIEDGVWIGPLAIVMKGVRIGCGAVIEPGAVITRDVPPGARMLGNPARSVADNG